MVMTSVENFLETLQKKFYLQNITIRRNFNSIWRDLSTRIEGISLAGNNLVDSGTVRVQISLSLHRIPSLVTVPDILSPFKAVVVISRPLTLTSVIISSSTLSPRCQTIPSDVISTVGQHYPASQYPIKSISIKKNIPKF